MFKGFVKSYLLRQYDVWDCANYPDLAAFPNNYTLSSESSCFGY